MENEERATQKAVFEHNKQLMISACKASGITMLVCEYSGGGDEGRIDSRTAFIGTQSVDFPEGSIKVQRMNRAFNSEHCVWHTAVVESEMTLEALLEHMTDEGIDLSNNSGYEDGTGGGGEVVVKVEAGIVVVDHYNVVETREEVQCEL